MSEELKINISVAGDTTKLAQTEAALNAVNTSTKNLGEITSDAGKETKKASDLIDEFGRRGGEGAHAMEGLAQAMRGGLEGSLIGGARSLHAMREALESTIGAVSIGIGVFSLMVSKLTEMWEEADADHIKLAADATKAHFDVLSDSIEKTNKADTKNLEARLQAIADKAKLAAAAIDEIAAAQTKADSAAEKLEILRIKNDPMMSEEAKAGAIADIEERGTQTGRAETARKKGDQLAIAQSEASSATTEETTAAQKKAEAEKAFDSAFAAAHASAIAGLQLEPAQQAFQGAEQAHNFDEMNRLFAQIKEIQYNMRPEVKEARDFELKIADANKKEADANADKTHQKANEARNALARMTPSAKAEALRQSTEASEDESAAITRRSATEAGRQKDIEAQAKAERERFAEIARQEGENVSAAAKKFHATTPAGQRAIDEAASAGQHLADHGSDGEAQATNKALIELLKAVQQHLVTLPGRDAVKDLKAEIDRTNNLVKGLQSVADSKL